MAGFIGKLVLLTSILAQAYFLYQEPVLVKEFEGNLKAISKLPFWKHESIPAEVTPLIKEMFADSLCVRQVVCGLLASAGVYFLLPFCLFSIFPIFGQLLFIAITSNPLLDQSQQTMINFLKNVAILGGLFLWCNSNCASKCNKKNKVKQE